MKIYLAGPEVFLPNAVEIGNQKKKLCETYSLTGLFPFDNEVSFDLPQPDTLIYLGNKTMMHEADVGIFNLTPFRGPSADVGTVFELGMFVGMGKPVYGYTNTVTPFVDRSSVIAHNNMHYDANGYTVENFGNFDNLMIDNALHKENFIKMDKNGILDDLEGFERCLQLLLV